MRVLILRLSSLRDTARSATHRLLADLVRDALPAARVDMAFLPPRRTPRVTGLLTGCGLEDADLVLVTNAFVREALNLPWMLHANGLAPWAGDRPDSVPPILLGGSNAFAAQCLVQPDGRAVPDALFFGEAEESLPRFLRRWHADAAPAAKRERLLRAADGLDGFWITGALPPAPLRQAAGHVLPPPARDLPPLDTEAAGTARLTVALGCAAFCSFCFEGYERKPYREWTATELLTHARALKQACGARTAELDAFNLNHHAQLGELVEGCARLFDRLAFKSQRADGVAACPAVVDLERAAGKSSFTLGIEGISPRQRTFLAKSLTDAEIAAAIQTLLGRRIRELKLFFILTGHETSDDLADFHDFCLRLKGWLNQPAACTRTILSFGRLVRMPNTPLAFDRLFLDEAEWRFAVDGVAAVCRRTQLECRFAFDFSDYLGTQLLAACRHDHAQAVVALACRGLTAHDPWSPAETARLHAAITLGATDTVADAAAFPFVQRAVAPAFLHRRWEEASHALDTGYCLGAACLGCGACRDAAQRDALTGRPRQPAIPAARIAAVVGIEAEKRRLTPVYRYVTLPDEFAGHSPAWSSARLMQLLLAEHPEWTDLLLSAEEALFGWGDNCDRLVIPAGRTVVALRAWEPHRLARADVHSGMMCHDEAATVPAPFHPGVFARADLTLHTRLEPREASHQAGAWLNAQRLPHTLRRLRSPAASPAEPGEGWRLDLAPAALKRRAVFALDVQPGAHGGASLALCVSPKARLADLAACLPPPAAQPHLVCTRVAF